MKKITKFFGNFAIALLRATGWTYEEIIEGETMLYVTMHYSERGEEPVRVCKTEAEAKAAVARSKKAWNEMMQLEALCGEPPRGYCNHPVNGYRFLSKDGNWYKTAGEAEVADRLLLCHQTAAYKKARRRWTQEDGYIAIVA